MLLPLAFCREQLDGGGGEGGGGVVGRSIYSRMRSRKTVRGKENEEEMDQDVEESFPCHPEI